MAAHSPAPDRVDYLTALCRTVPYHLVEAVLRDPRPEVLGPQRFDGSLLFADVVGFTPMCERLAAAGAEGLSRLEAIVSGVFEHLLDGAIFPFRGYVVHFGGDSITVVFRGPDHARRAAAAALRAQRLMASEIATLVAAYGERLMLREGLSSGLIRLPVVGDATRRLVGCAGEMAHEALRMQHLAQPNEIAVHCSARDLLAPVAELRAAGPDHSVLLGLSRLPPEQGVDELGDRVQADVEAKIALLEPFMPEPLRSRLMSMPVDWRIEGELRTPVIMFSDIWGLDDEEGHLDAAVELSRTLFRTYRKYGGVVSKADLASRGHRLLIVFGLHRPSDNDAERAVLAALEASSRVRAFRSAAGLDVGIRTGIHAGSVYFGAVGSTHKHDITLIGDAVNVAARVSAAAAPFEVLVTRELLAPCEVEFDHSASVQLLAKGKSEPLQIHAVHGRAPGRAQYVRHRVAQRPIVGRDALLARLGSTVASALGEQGRFVGICGERGTGKSSLLGRALNLAAERGVTGIVGRCRFATRAVPFAAVASMFAAFVGISSGDDENARVERVLGGLEPYQMRRGAPELVSFLRAAWRTDDLGDEQAALAEAGARRGALDSIVEFIAKRLEQEPLLYALEDLHYADPLTIELAARLTKLTASGRFLFVVTYCPEPEVERLRRYYADELLLEPLTRQGVEELLRVELGAVAVEPRLGQFVWERTGGHPSHAVEVARFLRDRSLIRVRAGLATTLDQGLAALEGVVPATLAQLTLARLDELDAVERRVLRVASAIGRQFDQTILAQAAHEGVTAEGVAQAVGALQAHGLLSEQPQEVGELAFRDGVTREVAYGTIPDAERRKLHERIADAMEPLVATGGASAAVLALHRERAGQDALAAPWFERAASVALRSALLSEAVELADGWARVVDRIPAADQPDAAARAQMQLLRLGAAARRGLVSQALAVAEQLAPLRGLLDASQCAVVDLWAGCCLGLRGDFAAAIVRLESAHGAADPSVRVDAARYLTLFELWRGATGAAEQWCGMGREAAGTNGQRQAKIALVAAALRVARGEVAQAALEAQGLYQQAEAADDASGAADALELLGGARCAAGELAPAREALQRALELTAKTGRAQREAALWCGLGACHGWAGELERARGPLERALALAQELGAEVSAIESRAHLGAVMAASTDPHQGGQLWAGALADAERLGLRSVVAAARLLGLRIALAFGERERVGRAAAALAPREAVMPWPLHQQERARLLARAAALR